MSLGSVILIIVGIIFIIIGAAVLNASADVKTEKGSIEETLMKIPNTIAIGLIIGGIILFILGLLSLLDFI